VLRCLLALLALGIVHGYGSEAKLGRPTVDVNLLLDRQEYEAVVNDLEREVEEVTVPSEKAAILANLGVVYGKLGRFYQAEQTTRRALDLMEDGGGSHPGLALGYANLAAIYIEEQRFPHAKVHLEKALSLYRETPDSRPFDLVVILNNLAETERCLGRLKEAGRLYEEALELLERDFGPSHSSVPILILNLGVLRHSMGDTQAAIRYLRRALDLWAQAYGDSHNLVAIGHFHLAHALADAGNMEESERAFRQCLDIGAVTFGLEHPKMGEFLLGYAEVLKMLKRKREARIAKSQADAILRKNAKENALHQTIDVSELQALRPRDD
jgi:tetratricopeptide (TPR) repeat protein